MKIAAKATPSAWSALIAAGLLSSVFLTPAPSLQGAGSAPSVAGALGGPQVDLDRVEREQFMRGRAVFDRPFHHSAGLGTPELNADSCRACHQDPVFGGAGGLELNVSRFGFDDDGQGPFVDLPGGQVASKLHPPYVPLREEYDPVADVFEQRQTPSTLGLGLVSAIPDYVILANEDPLDLINPDGIFGVARMVDVGGVMEVGKFGWKAQLPLIADFGRDAMFGEIGITTPDDGRGLVPNTDGDATADPELSPGDYDDLVFFMTKLAPPARKGSTDPEVGMGEIIFDQINCDTCHIPSLQGPDGPVDLYSNLLLHDVMPVDFRGMSEPGAGVGMYRTPPLWGISDTAPYMHDGRAEDLDAAIRAHFSEAEAVRLAYEALSALDRAALITFLEDL